MKMSNETSISREPRTSTRKHDSRRSERKSEDLLPSFNRIRNRERVSPVHPQPFVPLDRSGFIVLTAIVAVDKLIAVTFGFANLVAFLAVVETRVVLIMVPWWWWWWFR